MEKLQTDSTLLSSDLDELLQILQKHSVFEFEHQGLKLKLMPRTIENKHQIHHDPKEDDAALHAARAKDNENFGIWGS